MFIYSSGFTHVIDYIYSFYSLLYMHNEDSECFCIIALLKDLPLTSTDLETVERGIDLGDYYKSTEWDLLAVPAKKYEKYYPCCEEP